MHTEFGGKTQNDATRKTHTHTYIYIYICVCVCVCVCVNEKIIFKCVINKMGGRELDLSGSR